MKSEKITWKQFISEPINKEDSIAQKIITLAKREKHPVFNAAPSEYEEAIRDEMKREMEKESGVRK